ncbi:hypothetical protein GJ744_000671 [Endocarpon pusillum]|uniref:Uncharacterized protein n=1 Tax=Endocarpon pusillum TaxID=364733 RepID=A0A8H7DZY4_9EURO|nr:hypothetical protein GJ744_000671 [Endocarpon pusillum]
MKPLLHAKSRRKPSSLLHQLARALRRTAGILTSRAANWLIPRLSGSVGFFASVVLQGLDLIFPFFNHPVFLAQLCFQVAHFTAQFLSLLIALLRRAQFVLKFLYLRLFRRQFRLQLCSLNSQALVCLLPLHALSVFLKL